MNIVKLTILVLATAVSEQGDGEHLEFVFGNVDEKDSQHRIIKEVGVYGTMPSLALKQKEKTLCLPSPMAPDRHEGSFVQESNRNVMARFNPRFCILWGARVQK